MVRVIAKKYTKALLSDVSKEQIVSYYEFFKSASIAFKEPKFLRLITSNEFDKKLKAEKVIEIFSVTDNALKNTIMLLSANKKLELIPYIAEEIRLTLGAIEGKAKGVIMTSGEVTRQDISELESLLSKKLGRAIELHVENSNFPGVQIEIPDLGIETEVSTIRLKEQVVEHILKAF